MAKIAVIGSGFSGISAACYLAKAGHDVEIFEKNNEIGGRARQFTTESGYVFDMGPSWYWMPDVFENFFRDFNRSPADYYRLVLLDPAFEIVFPGNEIFPVPANFEALLNLFEQTETGSAERLTAFMAEAEFKYRAAMNKLVLMPGLSVSEFADADFLKGVLKLQVFSSFKKHVRRFFKHPNLLALMEFPILFLGATAEKTPALYSLMNYAGLKLGTWYPMGGFGKVIEGMAELAGALGVKIHTGAEVEKIISKNHEVTAIQLNGNSVLFDAVVSSADYNHTEQALLDAAERNYPEKYWEGKTFAPSCLIFYLGIRKKLNKLQHHTLFFEEDLALHADEIYTHPQWPTRPLFYVCCPSRTDATVAPEGHENLFLLMPLAPGLNDSEDMRERYFDIMAKRLERHAGESFVSDIDYKKSYCVNDFAADYHSYKGNAYGLANTLMQTAILKPKIRNKKMKNLFYTGQLTVPGPGVPPALISGKVVAKELLKQLNKRTHEAVV